MFQPQTFAAAAAAAAAAAVDLLLGSCRPDAGRAGIPRHALMAMDGQEDSFVNESAELPDHAIIALLKREHLLTRAKLNALYFEHITGERRLRSLKTQLRQVSHCASHAAMFLALCIPAANAVLWHSSNFIE